MAVYIELYEPVGAEARRWAAAKIARAKQAGKEAKIVTKTLPPDEIEAWGEVIRSLGVPHGTV